jgi:hypothetical protein
MIDSHYPCTGSNNWTASVDAQGGSPGRINSTEKINPDESPPKLKTAYSSDAYTILLRFNEPVDSASAGAIKHYAIDNGLIIESAVPRSPLFDEVQLHLKGPMSENLVYLIAVNGLSDCANNLIDPASQIKAGIPVDAQKGELIINEILFNPRANGYDYVEVYNNSNKILDAAKLYIANRNASGQINSIQQLSHDPLYIFPDEYFVLTEDHINLQGQYLVENIDHVLTLPSMPSLPDDKGVVMALNFQGAVIDEVNYRDDWQFKLIDDPAGVALERIDPLGVSDDPKNWHSAASTAGFGTPTYKNSQNKELKAVNGIIKTSPPVFSPDNDGYDDLASVQYQLDEPGYLATVTIFDEIGRPVRNLVRNGILGLNGYWNWDGLNDKGTRLATGAYIVLTEIFHLKGKASRFKNVIVLARKLN